MSSGGMVSRSDSVSSRVEPFSVILDDITRETFEQLSAQGKGKGFKQLVVAAPKELGGEVIFRAAREHKSLPQRAAVISIKDRNLDAQSAENR